MADPYDMGPLPRNFLQPFDPATMVARDVGYGGPSTEYLFTVEDSEGRAVNIPAIWWDAYGNPHKLNPQNALAMAAQYEAQNALYSPRYDNIGQAVEFAQHRSANGGAMRSPLFEAWRGN